MISKRLLSFQPKAGLISWVQNCPVRQFGGTLCQERRRIDDFLEEALEKNVEFMKQHIQDNDLRYSVELLANIAHFKIEDDSTMEALLGGISFKMEQLTPELSVELARAIQTSQSFAFRQVLSTVYKFYAENTHEFSIHEAHELKKIFMDLDSKSLFEFNPNFKVKPKVPSKNQKMMDQISPKKTNLKLHSKHLEIQVDQNKENYQVTFLDEKNKPRLIIQGYSEASYESINAIRSIIKRNDPKYLKIYIDELEVNRSLLVNDMKKKEGGESSGSFNDFVNDLLVLKGESRSRIGLIHDELQGVSAMESGKWRISQLSREMVEHYIEQKYKKNKEEYRVDNLQQIVRSFSLLHRAGLKGKVFRKGKEETPFVKGTIPLTIMNLVPKSIPTSVSFVFPSCFDSLQLTEDWEDSRIIRMFQNWRYTRFSFGHSLQF